MDGFAGYRTAVMSVLLHAQMVVNPFSRRVCRC